MYARRKICYQYQHWCNGLPNFSGPPVFTKSHLPRQDGRLSRPPPERKAHVEYDRLDGPLGISYTHTMTPARFLGKGGCRCSLLRVPTFRSGLQSGPGGLAAVPTNDLIGVLCSGAEFRTRPEQSLATARVEYAGATQ